MARIYPFRALRYNPSRVRLEDVVTQPYDKITPSMQAAYYQRSPYNLVRLILGLPELFDDVFDGKGKPDVYQRAARDFADWREKGVLARETDPCVFAYSQRFLVPGGNAKAIERRGFIALGELSDYSQGVVFPHEQTLAKPMSDRLNLLRATRAHFGQIFTLYSDPGKTAEKLIFATLQSPEIEVTDEFGVYHRVSRISDPATIKILCAAMEDKKLIIADGHHRYETALEYSRAYAPRTATSTERSSNALPQPPYPEAAVMMTFVNMDSQGLVILPTHRVIFGLEGFSISDFLEKAGDFFEIEEAPSFDADQLVSQLAAVGAKQSAFIAVTPEGRYMMRAKAAAMGEALQSIPERKRRLDVTRLHTIVLEKILGITPEAVRDQTNLRYLRDAAEAMEQVAEGRANIAFLMNPLTLDQLREVSFAGDVLPQKSSDFYPKLLSGLAIYALD